MQYGRSQKIMKDGQDNATVTCPRDLRTTGNGQMLIRGGAKCPFFPGVQITF